MALLRLNRIVSQPKFHRAISIYNSQWTRKKNVSDPFPSKYHPAIEDGWYDWWKDSGFFQPNSGTCSKSSNAIPKKKFSMVLPPPNVTGVLHLGHALTATIQVLDQKQKSILKKIVLRILWFVITE